MDVYFVRHGQTDGNVAKRHQAEQSRLTSEGKLQAMGVAKRVAVLQPTHLLVSNRVRAIQTGTIIAEITGLTAEVSELFTELCRPKNIYGHHHRSLRSVWYLVRWYLGLVGGEDCGEAGESYRAFRIRMKTAKAALTAYPADARIVVVSHSVFINFFVAHYSTSSWLWPWHAFIVFYRVLTMKNGDVVHLVHNHKL